MVTATPPPACLPLSLYVRLAAAHSPHPFPLEIVALNFLAYTRVVMWLRMGSRKFKLGGGTGRRKVAGESRGAVKEIKKGL